MSTEQLKALYVGSGNWEFEEVEGIDNKRGYSAKSLTMPFYVSWWDRPVGVQLVEMVAATPASCDDFSAGLYAERELRKLVEEVVPKPWEFDLGLFLYGQWCNQYNVEGIKYESADVLNGVVIKSYYLPEIEALTIAFRPCGEREVGRGCQWTKP